MPSSYSPETAAMRACAAAGVNAAGMQRVATSWRRHFERMARDHGERLQKAFAEAQRIQGAAMEANTKNTLAHCAAEYARDATQRMTLTLDVLRERADTDAAHEAAGAPPVLIYDHEVALEGRTLPRPVNYMLLKILPPEGVTTYDWKRPYMIIDPRAGHGAGIGGFKSDSQVGVALHGGHPVYFVVFRPHPEPGQTLADVMRAEAEFVAEIRRRHPEAPKPILVGNCQGGWATLVLAAANPDITGPLVINGAPVAYWSGELGANPMRFSGGLLGGILPALLLSDIGGGEFDGAHLVSNFEMLNPGRNFIGKYYDLYANPEGSRESFLAFEKWWGGFHFMSEAEMRWIIEQLFIGNRLARGEARIEHGRNLDLKAIRSPIIVFASWGDNITPPQQALNWIVDTYTDEHEIRIRGQRIIYMLHNKVGHLGIFVSSSIARKEHAEMASTMKTIEALPPGLYEMTIDEQIGEGMDAHFHVSFHDRKLSDILVVDNDDRTEERGFAAVARLSEFAAELYDLTARPYVQGMIPIPAAEAIRRSHPARASRRVFGGENLLMRPIRELAETVRKERAPAAPTNPFLAWEKWWSDAWIQSLDLWRDGRDAINETAFLSIYGSSTMDAIAETHAFKRTHKSPAELRYLPEVRAILTRIERGGFAEAVSRMLIQLAGSRGAVRRDRLERSARVMNQDEPFASLGPERRAALIHEQSVIVEFEPDRAISTLSELLRDFASRRAAIGVVEYIAGAVEEMEPDTVRMLQRMRATLELAPIELAESAFDLPQEVPASAAA